MNKVFLLAFLFLSGCTVGGDAVVYFVDENRLAEVCKQYTNLAACRALAIPGNTWKIYLPKEGWNEYAYPDPCGGTSVIEHEFCHVTKGWRHK